MELLGVIFFIIIFFNFLKSVGKKEPIEKIKKKEKETKNNNKKEKIIKKDNLTEKNKILNKQNQELVEKDNKILVIFKIYNFFF